MENKPKSQKKLKNLKLLPKSNKLKVLAFADLVVTMIFMVMMTLVDALPKTVALVTLIILLLLLVVTLLLLRDRSKAPLKRRFGIAFSCVLIIVFGAASYYLGSAFSMFNRISSSDIKSSNINVVKQPFNVYITGNDLWSNDEEDYKRSDMNMIVTINPVTRKILLTSIPRDSYVALHTSGEMDKLTHSRAYGIDETLNTVKDWLGYDMDYYIAINFSAVTGIIDAMGGITVESPIAFTSAISDYSYEKGENKLTGLEALYFARERKAFDEGDEQRNINQQAVIEAMIKKLTTSATLLTNYNGLLNAMGNHMETNFSAREISALVKMQIEDLGGWQIIQQDIKGEGYMRPCASLSSDQNYSVQIPIEETVEAAKTSIDKTMNPTKEEIKKAKQAAKEREEKAMARKKQAFVDKIFGIFKK